MSWKVYLDDMDALNHCRISNQNVVAIVYSKDSAISNIHLMHFCVISLKDYCFSTLYKIFRIKDKELSNLFRSSHALIRQYFGIFGILEKIL